MRHILAVSSCKGGVGKSTVAVNLAYALQSKGYQVGLFDADVYGPSLPTLVRPDATEVYQRNDLIMPLPAGGLKVMSFGFVTGDHRAPAIMRGPMVTSVIQQLLGGCEWGHLDVLVIDFPPGTGDIQLTLTQAVPISGAVIVTTPQELSLIDVEKGIQMFDKTAVPTLAVIENMSWFECGECGSRHYPFGQGARAKLVKRFGIEHSFELPMLPALSASSDRGKPYVQENPDSDASRVIGELASLVMHELDAEDKRRVSTLEYNVGQDMILTLPDGSEHEFPPRNLRLACQCAACIDEHTGKALLDPSTIDEDVYPTNVRPLGNYAAAVEWSDGHTSSVYPFKMLEEKFVTR